MGKLMYQMQYSRPDIAQAVCDLARHMTRWNLMTLKQWRDAWDLSYAQGRQDFCRTHLQSGMDPMSISSASEGDQTRTMQRIIRQDVVSLGTLYNLKMPQLCIEVHTENGGFVILQSRVECSSTLCTQHDVPEEHAGINWAEGWTSCDPRDWQ